MSAELLRKAVDTLRNDEDLSDIDALVPGLTDALATWLTHSARCAEIREEGGTPPNASADPRPLRVARLIVGDES